MRSSVKRYLLRSLMRSTSCRSWRILRRQKLRAGDPLPMIRHRISTARPLDVKLVDSQDRDRTSEPSQPCPPRSTPVSLRRSWNRTRTKTIGATSMFTTRRNTKYGHRKTTQAISSMCASWMTPQALSLSRKRARLCPSSPRYMTYPKS